MKRVWILAAAAVLSISACSCRDSKKSDINTPKAETSLSVKNETADKAAAESVSSVSSDTIYYSFTDSTAYRVELKEKPVKTAVLFSSYADIWICAGGSIAVTVGEAIERGFAEEGTLLVDESAGKQINLEALIAADPDFVICSADLEGQMEAASLLRDASIPCAAFHVETFWEYLDMLKICTEILERPDLFMVNGLEVEKRIEDMMGIIPDQSEAPEILFIRAGSGESSVKAKRGEDHFAAAMLEELGAHNIADDVPVLLDGLSTEEILMKDPDIIFITTMGKEAAAREYMDSVLAEETWQSLSAVKKGSVYYLPKDLFQYKPNAKWDKAYAYLAELLFPDFEYDLQD